MKITDNIVVTDTLYSTLLVNNSIYIGGKLITQSGIINKDIHISSSKCNKEIVLPFNGYYKHYVVILNNETILVNIKPELKTKNLKASILILNNTDYAIHINLMDMNLSKSSTTIKAHELTNLSVTLINEVCIGTYEIYDNLNAIKNVTDQIFIQNLVKQASLSQFNDIGSKLGKHNSVICCENEQYKLHTLQHMDTFIYYASNLGGSIELNLKNVPNVKIIFEESSLNFNNITLNNIEKKGFITFENKSSNTINVIPGNNQLSFTGTGRNLNANSITVFVISPYNDIKFLKTKTVQFMSVPILTDDFFNCIQMFG